MQTPLYKSLKNGTTLYVFPSVSEDKNFENQNETYKMSISHFALVKFPKQIPQLDFDTVFYQNATSIQPAAFKDQLVESLRNYVANHESVIRNTLTAPDTFYYDVNELYTTTEKIFWKWAKALGVIDFDVADPVNEFYGSDAQYDDLGPFGNVDYFREYLWKERDNTVIYDVLGIAFSVPGTTIPAILPAANVGMQQITITLASSSNFRPGDYLLVNVPNLDSPTYSTTQSRCLVVGLATTTTTNDTLVVEVLSTVVLGDFGTLSELEIINAYERFIKFIGEVVGTNNVQLPDKAYTETFANISYQHGQTPYSLFNIKSDNNYKPNSSWPLLATQIQTEIQGGENPNNPILTLPANYPGDIWAHFDTAGFLYETKTGNDQKRSGDYYGVSAVTNASPTLLYPDFDGQLVDGITLNLNIADYVKANSNPIPIESFNEFAATAFNDVAPSDFDFNAILWYYTLEDVSGETSNYATNLYGVEFLNTPANDLLYSETIVPVANKWVSNGYQDGNAYTYTLDLNYAIDSDIAPPSFDPEKVYSLFDMEMFQEALMRITYFSDQLTTLINTNIEVGQRVAELSSLVMNSQDIETISNRMYNIEQLIQLYSTLQIGDSDTIIPFLDTSTNPPQVLLNSVDKRWGEIYTHNTDTMYTEYINTNGFTDINIVEKTIAVSSGKDFAIVINNNDVSDPTDVVTHPIPTNQPYDTTKNLDHLSIVIDKDLKYKQTVDLYVLPKVNQASSGLVHPINDKKLDLWINYNDSIATVKKLLGTFSLPVLKYKDGSSYYDEPVSSFVSVPDWKVKEVYYAKANTNERIFSFLIEEDFVNEGLANQRLDQLNRIILDNFYIELEPNGILNNFYNLSSQYEIYPSGVIDNPSYVNAPIVSVELVAGGTGYTTGLVTSLIYDTTGVYSADIMITDTAGVITSVELMNFTGLSKPADMLSNVAVPGGVGGEVTFKLKKLNRINIAFNINLSTELNTLFAEYDTFTGVNSLPVYNYKNISSMCKLMPDMSLLKGYHVQLSRISDDDTLPITLLEQRYSIKINKL